jgi:hypothetical protein
MLGAASPTPLHHHCEGRPPSPPSKPNRLRVSIARLNERPAGAGPLPHLLTCAERLQYEGYLRRQETNAAIMALLRGGVPIKEIVRRSGRSRQLVSQVSRGQSTDMFPYPAEHTRRSLAIPGRTMGGGLSEWSRTLAPPATAGLPRLATCRQRMGDTAATSGEGDRPTASESAVRENDHATDGHGARSS